MSDALKNSKFVQLISVLDPVDRKQFRKWLDFRTSDHKENHQQIVYDQLLHLLRQQLPISKVNMIKPIRHLLKGEKQAQKEVALRNLFYKLKIHLRDFIAWKNLESKDAVKDRYLQEFLISNQAYDLAAFENKKANKLLEGASIRNVQYFENSIYLQENEFFLNIILKNKNPNDNLEELVGYIRKFLLARLLLYYNAAQNRERILNVNYNLPFRKFVFDFLENGNDLEEPYLKLHYTIFKVLTAANADEDYSLAYHTLLNNSKVLSLVDKRQILNFLFNFCHKQIKAGNPKYNNKKFDLIKFGIKEKVWTAGIYFSESLFIQFVKTAISLNEMPWATSFVKTHRAFLPPKVQQDVVHFSLALIHFKNGDFEEAEEENNQIVQLKDFSYYMDYRILSLKIYLEVFDYSYKTYSKSLINSILESMRQYLSAQRNKKMAAQIRKEYSNFVRIYSKIWRRLGKLVYFHPLNRTSFLKLEKEVKELQPLIERDWLLEKVEFCHKKYFS